jgi:hypothetical protein
MNTGTFPGYIVKNGVPTTLGALAPEGPTIGSHNNLPGHDGPIETIRVSSAARAPKTAEFMSPSNDRARVASKPLNLWIMRSPLARHPYRRTASKPSRLTPGSDNAIEFPILSKTSSARA